jgi:2-polyprenyl-3-methyl-5-hydroxy-6-metoxy-1,4-benzoquinol methylase
MPLFRLDKEFERFERDFSFDNFDTTDSNEWKDESSERLKEPGWENRYEYEASLVQSIRVSNPHISSILELGSGPGVLSQKVLAYNDDVKYDLVDKPYAKEYFDKHKFKGRFFVKDLSNDFDITGLKEKYDFVIINDFLEHVFNPSIIVQKVYEITDKESVVLVSNPNWRMNHQFIYRGLFDYDNFLYFMYAHKFKAMTLNGSILKTKYYPKRDSETLLPDDKIQDWNHYITFKHRI